MSEPFEQNSGDNFSFGGKSAEPPPADWDGVIRYTQK